jgi:exonuclease SbcC
MITKLRLKNWKSHLDSEFKFSDGVNALIGIMGSGKSSVTQAVCFALFGTFPALQTKRITLNDLIMKKPSMKSGCEVEVDFVADGKEYRIRRVVESKKGTSLAEISEGGKLIDEGPQAVTRAVESVLQMDYELFSRAVYSEQNGLDHFLRIPKGSRMQQIDEMLKVDRFEKAREETVGLANKVKNRRDEKLRTITDLEKEGVDEKIATLNSEITQFQNEREGLQKDVEAVRKEKGSAEQGLESVEGKESELNESRQEIQGIRSGLSEVEKNIETKKKRLEEFGGVDGIAEKTGQLDTDIEKLKHDSTDANSAMLKARDEITSINTEIKLITDSITELEGVEAKCHVCDSPMTDEKKKGLLESRKGKEKELSDRTSALAASAEEHNQTKAKLDGELRDKELEKERLSSVSGEADAIREMEARKDAYIKREAVLAGRISELEKALKETDISALRQKLRDIAARESEAATKLGGINNRISDKQDILKHLVEKKDILDRYKEEIKQDTNITEMLGNFVKVLRMTQEQLREEFLKTVNGIMSEIWNELYPYGDFSSIRLSIEGGDYILQLKETTPGEASGEESWISVDGIASGGERSMACLALRIAFSKAFIPNLKWLILDEPTHNLDSNAIEQFSQILREKIDQFVDQVFLITHEERISEAVGGSSGSLHHLERDKEANEPTRVKTV